MCINILKKDLKRKKTMNVILLVFIILATMFVSSSVNNIITVSSALDNYFEKAGIRDYFVLTKSIGGTEESISDFLDRDKNVESYAVESIMYVNAGQMNTDDSVSGSTSILLSIDDAKLNYFDSDNRKITKVNDGEIFISQKYFTKSNIKLGDIIPITIGDVTVRFKVVGGFKDAFLGSDMMSITRFLISQKDYDMLESDSASGMLKGDIAYIDTDNEKELAADLNAFNANIIFMDNRDTIALTYLMDMMVAGCLLVVSVCLILIAFVVLRFTITFTLSEEYREIGVMKAIGIKNIKIRSLYLVKYFMLSVFGAAIGFFTGLPFGNMLLKSVSQSMVMGEGNRYFVNFICAVAVIGIIMLFCFRCTGKVNKLTPIDAIRNGSKGESFKRKSILSLNKSKLKPVVFMAFNDILSSFKRYGIMAVTFLIGLMMIIIIANNANTLQSEKLIKCFAMVPGDVYMSDESEIMKFFSDGGRELEKEKLSEIEKKLSDNGIPARCVIETMMMLSVKNDENTCKVSCLQGTGTTTDEYSYTEGTAPQNVNEIAMTKITAEKVGAKIGDKVIVSQLDGEKEYILTAYFQSLINMGEGLRFHEDAEINYIQAMGSLNYDVIYTDNPDKTEKEERFEKIEELFENYKVNNGDKYVNEMVGGVGTTLDELKLLIIVVVLIICMLVAVLMERSFIENEKGEIAMMKATGFRNSAVICRHTLRMAVVMAASTLITLIVSTPVSKLATGKIFEMMGTENIEFDIEPFEVFVQYPAILLAVTLLSVFITAQFTRKIAASDTANME